MVWEPFGGLATGSIAGLGLGCQTYAAEIDPEFARIAAQRLSSTERNLLHVSDEVRLSGPLG